jgi:heat shock protein HspQ
MIAPIKIRCRFHPGQLVRHKRYRYRGVIVAWDPCCKASEAWYRSNKTQPARNQPWYHVLVHGSRITTYAAETSLEDDPSGEPVEHPLVDAFFLPFDGIEYVRNELPWPPEGPPDGYQTE